MVAPKYEPVSDVLNFEVALIQAQTLLDLAAQKAIKSENIEAMVNIAAVWGEMASRMNDMNPHHNPSDDDDDDETTKLGFVARKIEVEHGRTDGREASTEPPGESRHGFHQESR